MVNTNTSIKMVAGMAGCGKLLPLDVPVLTPKGWVLNGSLKVGDYVISQDGKATKVLEVHDQLEAEIYNVVFGDGSSVQCCDEHLWSVRTPHMLFANQEPITLPLKDMLHNILHMGGHGNYYSIDLVNPVEFNAVEVPLDPYRLGYLIMKNKLISTKVNTELIGPLTWLGLLGCDNKTKFIPDVYLYNSIEVRKQLLAGLLDASSIISMRDKGRVTNTLLTTSHAFAMDVIELIRGLGGDVFYNPKGYRISIGFSNIPFNPYRDSFKREMFDKHKCKFKRVKKIKSATYVGKKAGRCILVDNPSHLYVVKDYIVTHNTYKLREEVDKSNLFLTASTGIAAVNLAETACTIHSLLKALEGADILKGLISGRLFKTFNTLFNDYNGIAIDEAPMLNREYIDSLIKAMDVYGSKVDRQLELYLTGDIAQLAPIKGDPYFKSIFLDRIKTEVLTTVYRQTDLDFKEALSDLRLGKNNKIKELLVSNNCFVDVIQPNFLGLTLFSTKVKVEAYNIARLKMIEGYDEVSYKGYKMGKVDNTWNSFLDPVVLKVGTLVRCITNLTTTDGSYVANGDMGLVEELYKDSVVVNILRTGKSVVIKPIKKKILNPDSMVEEGSINYLPLKLSFACTVHSIQGITTESLQVSMSSDTFMGRCSGMAYVALSRNKNIQGLKIIGNTKDFDRCSFIDPQYLRFIHSGQLSN